MNIYGLAFIKNGVKYDFPFMESLYSLQPIVEKISINVGVSDDGTLQELQNLNFLDIIEVEWDDHRSDNGYIFSDMTNIPLKKLRQEADSESNGDAWVIYLQSDEVIHEEDFETIKNDILQAEQQGCDAVKFRYLHFWQNHNEIAIGKKWYPQEIRAIRLNSNVVNYGDAQTFSGYTKTYESNAHIYHYGHVREEKAYKAKIDRQARYHQKGFKYYRKKIKNFFKKLTQEQETIPFYGDHPEVMKDRIARLGGEFIAEEVESVNLITENAPPISDYLISKINSKSILFNDQNTLPQIKISDAPLSMRSPQSRRWESDFRWLVALSLHGVGTKK